VLYNPTLVKKESTFIFVTYTRLTPSEMEHAPKGLAFLQKLEGFVDVRERHVVCYEPIKV